MNSFKKILITTDNVGTIWNYTMELIAGLEKEGYEITLAVINKSINEERKKQISCFKNIRIYYGNYKSEWMEDPWEDVDEAGEWLLNIRDEFHPDIVHLNNYSFGALNWGIPVITFAHSDVISWWKAVLKYPYPNRLNEYFKRVKFGLENASVILAPSESAMHSLNQTFGNFPNQRIIYYGRSLPRISTTAKNKTVFSIGSVLDSAKNISLVINSAPMFQWKVKIAGPSAGNDEVEFSAHRYVEFLGDLSSEKIFKYLAKSPLFVLPAKYEPFGLSVLEAALSGCALILGDIDSLKEIWGDAAVYVDTEDSDILIKCVNELIDDPALLQLYRNRALKQASRFSAERMIDEHIQIYNSVIKRRESLSYKL